jgi:hypothetical protein
MQQHNTYDTSLALAGVSFVTILGALSVSRYDCPIIIGVAILSGAAPLLASFSRWTPPDLLTDSTWRNWLANHLFVVAMPAALIGIAFVLAHVHILCGALFAASSFTGIGLYWRRVLELQRPKSASQPKA